MPIFRRRSSSRSNTNKDAERERNTGSPPSLDLLNLSGNLSLVNLVSSQQDARSEAGKGGNGYFDPVTTSVPPAAVSGKDVPSSKGVSLNTFPKRTAPKVTSKAVFTPPATPPTTGKTQDETTQKTQSSNVPAYHRPWPKASSPSTQPPSQSFPPPLAAQQRSPSQHQSASPGQGRGDQPHFASTTTTTPKRHVGPPPSAFAMHKSMLASTGDGINGNGGGAYSVMGQPLDFRVSPNLPSQQSPSQRKSMVDAARKMSLKRSKAPNELNIMVVGSRATGKTSWIRTLLSTCDLSACSEEARQAAATFGLSTKPNHSTRKTIPPTTVRTRSFNHLSGIELPSWSVLPLQALASGESIAPNRSNMRRASSVTSFASTAQASKLHVSICDTPGYDFGLEDEVETERKTLSLLRHIESKLNSTLAEESKVQRQALGDDHVHLVLYFIDPLHLVDRTFARRVDRERMRMERLEGKERAKDAVSSSSTGHANTRTNGHGLQGTRRRSASAAGAAEPIAFGADGKSEGSSEAVKRSSSSRTRSRSLSRSGDSNPPGVNDLSLKELKMVSGTENPQKATNGNKEELRNVEEMEDEDEEDDDDDEEENDEKFLGLSNVELSIISRLSQRANVVPVLAKSDLLTASRSEEVRSAVLASLVDAKIDLGAFDVRGNGAKREAGKGSSSRHRRKQRGKTEVARSATADNEWDEPQTLSREEPVKVIKIRPRRSYSGASESVRPNMENVADGSPAMGGDDYASESHERASVRNALEASSLHHVGSENAERKIPFNLFSPEPIRPRKEDKMLANSRPRGGSLSGSDNGEYVEAQKRIAGGSLNAAVTNYKEDVPPVPPLPRGLVAHQASPVVAHEELPTSESIVKSHKHIEGLATPPSMSTSSPIFTPTTQASPMETKRRPLTAESKTENDALTRFERAYKWGSANVLDPTQSDFALLRTCLLDTHIEAIKEGTTQRYEQYRAERLEARRSTRDMSESEHRQLLVSLNAL